MRVIIRAMLDQSSEVLMREYFAGLATHPQTPSVSIFSVKANGSYDDWSPTRLTRIEPPC
jgi:hypothetical protein